MYEFSVCPLPKHPREELVLDDAERSKVRVWSELLREWDSAYRKRFRSLADLAAEGVPDPLRGMVWCMAVESTKKAQHSLGQGLGLQVNTVCDVLNTPACG